ncbi:MAG: 50S ribosomal protein L17 [Firmicutes bacterium HGW-Firmicutes-21]|nr:MAG: 50S ribosomal protein L17 [Firmicutes bacterium HGW-Firmicutes-21]
MPGTRKLGRPTDHRMSMIKGMVTFLLEKGQIETTVTRAKEVSALTDKMITLGKANTLAARRQAMAFLKKESVVAKLFNVIAPIYDERNGGYTRVLKTGPRRGDGAEMSVIAMVDADSVYAVKDKKAKKAAAEESGKESTPAEKKPAAKKAPSKKTPVDKAAPKKSAAKKDTSDKDTAVKKPAPKRTAKPKVEAAPAETAEEADKAE